MLLTLFMQLAYNNNNNNVIIEHLLCARHCSNFPCVNAFNLSTLHELHSNHDFTDENLGRREVTHFRQGSHNLQKD